MPTELPAKKLELAATIDRSALDRAILKRVDWVSSFFSSDNLAVSKSERRTATPQDSVDRVVKKNSLASSLRPFIGKVDFEELDEYLFALFSHVKARIQKMLAELHEIYKINILKRFKPTA